MLSSLYLQVEADLTAARQHMETLQDSITALTEDQDDLAKSISRKTALMNVRSSCVKLLIGVILSLTPCLVQEVCCHFNRVP